MKKSSQSKRILVLSTLALSLFILSACSSSSAPKFPTGKFVSASDEYRAYIFNADKTWSYTIYDTVGAEGKYSLKGNLWTEKGTEECPFPGTYEWTYDGSWLSFKLVGEDECDPRREATDGQTFILVSE